MTHRIVTIIGLVMLCIPTLLTAQSDPPPIPERILSHYADVNVVSIQMDTDPAMEYKIQYRIPTPPYDTFAIYDDASTGFRELIPNQLILKGMQVPPLHNSIPVGLKAVGDPNNDGYMEWIVTMSYRSNRSTLDILFQIMDGTLFVYQFGSVLHVLTENNETFLLEEYVPAWYPLIDKNEYIPLYRVYVWNTWRWTIHPEKTRVLLELNIEEAQNLYDTGSCASITTNTNNSLNKLLGWLYLLELYTWLEDYEVVRSLLVPTSYTEFIDASNLSAEKQNLLDQCTRAYEEWIQIPESKRIEQLYGSLPTYIRHDLDLNYYQVDNLSGVAAYYDSRDQLHNLLHFPGFYSQRSSLGKTTILSVYVAEVIHPCIWFYQQGITELDGQNKTYGFEVYDRYGTLISREHQVQGDLLSLGTNLVFIQSMCHVEHWDTTQTYPPLLHFYSRAGVTLKKQLPYDPSYFNRFRPPIHSFEYKIIHKDWLQIYHPTHSVFTFIYDAWGNELQSPANYVPPTTTPEYLAVFPERDLPEPLSYYATYNIETNTYANPIPTDQLETRYDDTGKVLPVYIIHMTTDGHLTYFRKQYGFYDMNTTQSWGTSHFYTSNGRVYKSIRDKYYRFSNDPYYYGISCHEYYDGNGLLDRIDVYGLVKDPDAWNEKMYEDYLPTLTLWYHQNQLTDVTYHLHRQTLGWITSELKGVYQERSEIYHYAF